MSFFTPNFSVDQAWRGTLSKVFQQLRRVKFVVDNTFSFGDFDPQVNWNGMTATNVNVYRARYLKIFGMLWISVHLGATLAAPFTNFITITIPATAAGESTETQAHGIRIQNAGIVENGVSGISGGNNSFFLNRTAGNFTAGAALFYANVFIEVL